MKSKNKNYNTRIKRCRYCIMPEVKNVFEFDEHGVCPSCRSFKHMTAESSGPAFDDKSPDEKMAIFKRKVAKLRSKNSPYDCAVAVSGGKDSIMTLYIAKKILGLNPLAIFIDNGFALDQMYENIKNATDILEIDAVLRKTHSMKRLFRLLLTSGKNIYYCRVCHAFLDLLVNQVCSQYNIRLVLGGYTKGQQYIINKELFRIYDESDRNTIEVIKHDPEFGEFVELFRNQSAYFYKNYGQIVHMTPFKYVEWNEDQILDTLYKELDFRLPERSWPDKSSNCTFNYVAQLLAMKQFGFAQHESELSELVRQKEMTRERALEIIETPIETADLENPLKKLHLTCDAIGITD